jgi:ABC-type transport system involved in multi-copper enzyme maturation permease subunit
MLWNLYLNENVKLFRRALYWVGLAVLLVTGVGILGLFYAATALPMLSQNIPAEQIASFRQALTWPVSFPTALQFCGTSLGLGGLLALVLVGVVTAQEYPWRTLNLAVGHGTPRGRVMAAKLLAIFTALAGWLVVLMLAVGAFTAFTTRQFTGSLDFGSVNPVLLGLSILRTILALAPYVTLTFCLALATRSMVTAIGVVAGYSLVVEPLFLQLIGLAGGGISGLASWLPMMLGSTLLKANDPTGAMLSPGSMDPGTAAAGIAVYASVFLLASWLIFRRQDLSS